MHRSDLNGTVHGGWPLNASGVVFDRDCAHVHLFQGEKLFGELGDTEAADLRRQLARIPSAHHAEDLA